MSRPFSLASPALERAADELAARSDRFEIFAKVGESVHLRHRGTGSLEEHHAREEGVGCRAVVGELAGFGAAAGSDAASGRDAARAALASLVPGPDPLPPRHLLAAAPIPPGPSRLAVAEGRQVVAEVVAALARVPRLLLGEVRLHHGRWRATLATSEGFVARAGSAACVVEVLAAAAEGPWRLFQVAAAVPAKLPLDPLATAVREVTLLTARGSSPPAGVTRALLAPPAAAPLVVALAEHLMAGREAAGLTGARVAPGWALYDERPGPGGLVPVPFDGEGFPSRRLPLAAGQRRTGRLGTWADARRYGCLAGAAVRPSYREPPRAGPANLLVAPANPHSSAELLRILDDGLYVPVAAGTLTVDARGRFALPVAAVTVRGGRFAEAHPVAELRGSFRRLLEGLEACGDDAWSLSLTCGVTTPSLLFRTLQVG